jgi:DNA topoisomerase-3
MNIIMDKFKTSEMGKALKRVYRGEIAVQDSVAMAEEEIRQYFGTTEALPAEEDTDVGFFGDVIGTCPLCGNEVKRYKVSYGCSNYKNGCKFNLSMYICGRAVSVQNAKQLLQTGRTSKIKGFISKKGKPFDATLILSGARCVFDFSDNAPQAPTEQ